MRDTPTPDRLYVSKRYVVDFRQLASDLDVDAKNVFFMAMALGFLNKEHEELEAKEGYILIQNIKEPEHALMSAIAFDKTGNLGVFLDKKRVYTIAEEYASGGLKYLKNDVIKEQFGSYNKRLESQLLQQFSKLII